MILYRYPERGFVSKAMRQFANSSTSALAITVGEGVQQIQRFSIAMQFFKLEQKQNGFLSLTRVGQ